MDCPLTAKYQSALACFSAQNQQRILPYLALLATRHSAATTLAAVVTTLNALRRQLPGARQGALTEDLTQATAQDIVAFITASQAAGLAPPTINTKLGLLTAFFEYLRDEGQMAQQPVRRQQRRSLRRAHSHNTPGKGKLPCRSTKKATCASTTKKPAPASHCSSFPAAG